MVGSGVVKVIVREVERKGFRINGRDGFRVDSM